MKTTVSKKKVFSLKGKINEIAFSKRTSDIKQTILELKPDFVFTDSYFTLSTGTGANKIITERKLSLLQGKRLFNNENVLDIFILNLTQEYA